MIHRTRSRIRKSILETKFNNNKFLRRIKSLKTYKMKMMKILPSHIIPKKYKARIVIKNNIII
jgi:hypothetical protein